jgi:hypothetical protein
MGSRYKPAAQTRPTLVSGRENKKQRKMMKKKIIRIVVGLLLLLVSAGSTPVLADGGVPAPPFCCPGCTCSD